VNFSFFLWLFYCDSSKKNFFFRCISLRCSFIVYMKSVGVGHDFEKRVENGWDEKCTFFIYWIFHRIFCCSMVLPVVWMENLFGWNLVDCGYWFIVCGVFWELFLRRDFPHGFPVIFTWEQGENNWNFWTNHNSVKLVSSPLQFHHKQPWIFQFHHLKKKLNLFHWHLKKPNKIILDKTCSRLNRINKKSVHCHWRKIRNN
jgi:hypothetical protein